MSKGSKKWAGAGEASVKKPRVRENYLNMDFAQCYQAAARELKAYFTTYEYWDAAIIVDPHMKAEALMEFVATRYIAAKENKPYAGLSHDGLNEEETAYGSEEFHKEIYGLSADRLEQTIEKELKNVVLESKIAAERSGVVTPKQFVANLEKKIAVWAGKGKEAKVTLLA